MKVPEIDTPWHRAQQSRSKIQESRVARMKGARPQVNSGRIWSSLRDNKLRSFIGLFLIDNKTHENPEKRSYRIEYQEWLQLRRDAQRTPPGCLPALQIDLQEIHLLTIELETWEDVERYVIELETRIRELEERENSG